MINEQNNSINTPYTKSDTITFEDLDYIRKNLKPLHHFDKNQALTEFLKQIEEPQKITQLRIKQAENTQKLEKDIQRLKSVEGTISNKQFQIKQEFAWLDRVCAFRTHLLSYLPRCYYKEGENFLNKFILENRHEEYKEVITPPQTHHSDPHTNYAPGMNPQKQNLKEKIKRILYSQHIQKFYDEFLQTNSEYKEFEARFDITRPIKTIKKEIMEKYDTSNLQKEYERINKEIEFLSSENEHLSQTINQTQATLALKREKFITYYNKQILTTDYHDEVVNKAIQNNQITGTAEQKQYLIQLLNTICEYSEIGRYIIHQSLIKETKYIIVPQNNIQHTQSTYINNTITLPDLSDSPYKSNLLMARIIYESKHALQTSDKNFENTSNVSNILLQKCLKECDALACTCAFSHDIKEIYPDIYHTLLSKTPYMQRAYSLTLNTTNDILKALNAAALAWNKDFGEYYKRTLCLNILNKEQNKTNSITDTIPPEDIVKTNNLKIFEYFYLDLNKIPQQILTLTDDIYTHLNNTTNQTQNLNDNSIEYINRQIQRITNKKDKHGLKIGDAKIIPGNKHFSTARIKTKTYTYQNLPLRHIHYTSNLQDIAQQSLSFNELFAYIQHKNIIFVETRGLTSKQIPIAALYNRNNNSIIINNSFTIDEQLLATIEIILSIKSTLLPPEFKIKSQLIYTNLSQAEQLTKLFTISKDIQTSYPLMYKKLKHDYPNIKTNTPKDIFISALKDATIRKKALNFLEQELPSNHPNEVSQILKISPTELVKLFTENIDISKQIKYIAQMSSTITPNDLKYLRNIAAHWQDDSIKDINIIDSYTKL